MFNAAILSQATREITSAIDAHKTLRDLGRPDGAQARLTLVNLRKKLDSRMKSTPAFTNELTTLRDRINAALDLQPPKFVSIFEDSSGRAIENRLPSEEELRRFVVRRNNFANQRQFLEGLHRWLTIMGLLMGEFTTKQRGALPALPPL